MKKQFTVSPIAHIENDYKDKFGIPRQSGLVPDLVSRIVFEKPYRNPDAIRGIQDFSHLWLLWIFSESLTEEFRPTVRPPRLGGNTRVGVFATRSPFRPNNIGLSSVKLVGVEETEKDGFVLLVTGADLLDGTPIVDIKPYIPYSDCHADAAYGFAENFVDYALCVNCSDELLSIVSPALQQSLLTILQNDPRPSYQDDPERIYAMDFADYNITFSVKDTILTVVNIRKNI